MFFNPGKPQNVYFQVPDDIGLTEISEEPRTNNPCVESAQINLAEDETRAIIIPMCQDFMFSVICESGQVEIRQNYADADTAVTLNTGDCYDGTFRRAAVGKFFIAGAADSVVNYDVEKVI
jgi:hypothetical protein